jgi:uncharacterized membrane protein
MPQSKSRLTIAKSIPYILAVGGLIGFLCAAIITYDKFQILMNPHYIPSCNLDPIIACGSVMQSKQAAAFGFPNPFLGLGGFAVVATIGIGMLAGAKFKRWFWLGLEAGTIFGIGFVHWLFFESVYRIHALCPYCMVVWVVTITTFWYVTLYNIDSGTVRISGGKPKAIYAWVRRHHLDLLILWFLIIAAFILKHFWYYYGHYL